MKNSEKILLVDDDRQLLQSLRKQLTASGFKVRTAASGAEALKIANGLTELDLLVTGVLLPELNGIELARTLLARRPGLKVAFISGTLRPSLADPEAPEEEPPLPPFLQKPFTPRTLCGFVKRCLGGEEEDTEGRARP